MVNNTTVYLLWHHIEYADSSEKSKVLGVFSSEEKCNAQKEKVEKTAHPEIGELVISSLFLNRSSWVEGFFTE